MTALGMYCLHDLLIGLNIFLKKIKLRADKFVHFFFFNDWVFYCISPRIVALPSLPDHALFLGEPCAQS